MTSGDLPASTSSEPSGSGSNTPKQQNRSRSKPLRYQSEQERTWEAGEFETEEFERLRESTRNQDPSGVETEWRSAEEFDVEEIGLDEFDVQPGGAHARGDGGADRHNGAPAPGDNVPKGTFKKIIGSSRKSKTGSSGSTSSGWVMQSSPDAAAHNEGQSGPNTQDGKNARSAAPRPTATGETAFATDWDAGGGLDPLTNVWGGGMSAPKGLPKFDANPRWAGAGGSSSKSSIESQAAQMEAEMAAAMMELAEEPQAPSQAAPPPVSRYQNQATTAPNPAFTTTGGHPSIEPKVKTGEFEVIQEPPVPSYLTSAWDKPVVVKPESTPIASAPSATPSKAPQAGPSGGETHLSQRPASREAQSETYQMPSTPSGNAFAPIGQNAVPVVTPVSAPQAQAQAQAQPSITPTPVSPPPTPFTAPAPLTSAPTLYPPSPAPPMVAPSPFGASPAPSIAAQAPVGAQPAPYALPPQMDNTGKTVWGNEPSGNYGMGSTQRGVPLNDVYSQPYQTPQEPGTIPGAPVNPVKPEGSWAVPGANSMVNSGFSTTGSNQTLPDTPAFTPPAANEATTAAPPQVSSPGSQFGPSFGPSLGQAFAFEQIAPPFAPTPQSAPQQYTPLSTTPRENTTGPIPALNQQLTTGRDGQSQTQGSIKAGGTQENSLFRSRTPRHHEETGMVKVNQVPLPPEAPMGFDAKMPELSPQSPKLPEAPNTESLRKAAEQLKRSQEAAQKRKEVEPASPTTAPGANTGAQIGMTTGPNPGLTTGLTTGPTPILGAAPPGATTTAESKASSLPPKAVKPTKQKTEPIYTPPPPPPAPVEHPMPKPHHRSEAAAGSAHIRQTQETGLPAFLKRNSKVIVFTPLVAVLTLSLGAIAVLKQNPHAFSALTTSSQAAMSPNQKAGEEALKNGRFSESVSYFDEALKTDANQPFVLHSRGKAYFGMANYQAALQDYSTALQTAPNNKDTLLDRAAVYFYINRFDDAIADYSSILKADSKDAEALFGRALNYEKTNQAGAAIKDLDAVIAVQPSYKAAWMEEGLVNTKLKAFDRAIAALNQAIKLDPKSPEAFYWRANAYQHCGKKGEAIRDFTEAISLRSGDGDYYNDRGCALLETQKYREALSDFASALQLRPDDRVAKENLERAAKALIKESTVRYSVNSTNPHTLCDFAFAYLITGKLNDATTAATKALELQKDSSDAYQLLGQAQFAQGKYQESAASLSEAVKCDPNNMKAVLWRARANVQMSHFMDAKSDYDKCAETATFSDHSLAVRERALVNYLLRNGEACVADTKLYINEAGWKNQLSGSASLLAWLANRQLLRNAEAASAALKEAAHNLKPEQWPHPVVRYLLKDITATELLSSAKTADQLTDVRTWVGFDNLLDGNTAGATKNLSDVRAKGAKSGEDALLVLNNPQ